MHFRPIRAADISPAGRLLPDCPWHEVYRQLLLLARQDDPNAMAYLTVDAFLAALDIQLPLSADVAERMAIIARMNLVIAQFNLPAPPAGLAALRHGVQSSGDPVGAAMERVRQAMAPFAE